jgi:hypothetical protein
VSENDYVATAAAEKRLREVLADRLPGASTTNVEGLALALLNGSKIEYKARAKQVTITLDLPDKATETKRAADDGSTGSAEYGGPPEPETIQTPPTPHLASFTPQIDPDADYEDVHYD